MKIDSDQADSMAIVFDFFVNDADEEKGVGLIVLSDAFWGDELPAGVVVR